MQFRYRHQSGSNYNPLLTLLSIVAVIGVMLVINGCVKMEATRKADWEN